ncbi:hypothetical protein SAMN06265370_101276 [Puniceibacterium sediminis]|uniref:Uncharacterized protein n=1 Tax=Puniceibacterium sediminis TaxID=1608407 RepID=A0A238UXR2_9RHOB|nr:hypothetical protein SAMN06265370_101276 [Puniceibacterium sediminis]
MESGPEIQRQGVDAAHEVGAEGAVDGAVVTDTRLTLKSRAADHHMKMAFAALLKPRMAPVAFAVIAHNQFTWIECFAQTRLDFLSSGHFLAFNLCHLSVDSLEFGVRVEKVFP